MRHLPLTSTLVGVLRCLLVRCSIHMLYILVRFSFSESTRTFVCFDWVGWMMYIRGEVCPSFRIPSQSLESYKHSTEKPLLGIFSVRYWLVYT